MSNGVSSAMRVWSCRFARSAARSRVTSRTKTTRPGGRPSREIGHALADTVRGRGRRTSTSAATVAGSRAARRRPRLPGTLRLVARRARRPAPPAASCRRAPPARPKSSPARRPIIRHRPSRSKTRAPRRRPRARQERGLQKAAPFGVLASAIGPPCVLPSANSEGTPMTESRAAPSRPA